LCLQLRGEAIDDGRVFEVVGAVLVLPGLQDQFAHGVVSADKSPVASWMPAIRDD
jgi:hypothetical protein